MKNLINNMRKGSLDAILIIFSLFMLASCEKAEVIPPSTGAQAPVSQRSASAMAPYTVLFIEHNCIRTMLPDYNVVLRSDGKVIYTGYVNVAQLGVRESSVDAATVSYIINLFESAHFFNIGQITSHYDEPFVTTTYSNKFRTKALTDYDQGIPQLLIQIRKVAEKKLNVSRFVSGDVAAPMAQAAL